MKTKLEQLEQIFLEAKAHNQLVYIGVETKDNLIPELIINHPDSIDSKLKYYKKAYTDDLVLKSYNGIKIVEVGRLNMNTVGDSKTNIHMEILGSTNFEEGQNVC